MTCPAPSPLPRPLRGAARWQALLLCTLLLVGCRTYEGSTVYRSHDQGPRRMDPTEYDHLLNLWDRTTPEALRGKTGVKTAAPVLVSLADLYERRYGLEPSCRPLKLETIERKPADWLPDHRKGQADAATPILNELWTVRDCGRQILWHIVQPAAAGGDGPDEDGATRYSAEAMGCRDADRPRNEAEQPSSRALRCLRIQP